MSTHYVRVVDGNVTDVWDTPPAEGVGNNGWRNAVEVRPDIIPNRQGYTAHTFDLTTDPVQIVWGTFDISVDDRKSSMVTQAKFAVQQAIRESALNPESFDPSTITSAQATMTARIAAINACNTHDELDALN